MLCFSFSCFRSLALLSFLLSFVLSLSFLHPFVLSFIFYSFHSLFLGLSLVHSIFPRRLHPLFILTFSLSPLSFICSFFSVSRFVLSLYLSFILSHSLSFVLSFLPSFVVSLLWSFSPINSFIILLPIIPSPLRGWDLVLPWFHVHYSSSSSCKTRLNFGLVFKISQWNLLGTLAMGLIAHILIYGSWNYDRKCAKKWTNESTNCEIPGRDGQNSFISWYLATRAEDFLV